MGLFQDVWTALQLIGYAVGMLLYFYLILFIVIIIVVGSIGLLLLIYCTIPKLPGYGRRIAVHLRENWTVSRWPFRWQSYKGFAHVKTPLLTESAACLGRQDCLTTSRLCKPCYRLVNRSRLLSGSVFPVIPRREWHRWPLPHRRTQLCHLCQILWLSLSEQTRNDIISFIQDHFAANRKPVTVWISIWKDEEARLTMRSFYDDPQPDKRVVLSDPISITRELRNGLPISTHASNSTGSAHCIELAKSWISDCETNHNSTCRCEAQSTDYMPKRLVYVGDQVSSALRVVETRSLSSVQSSVRYLALSYLPGKDGVPEYQKLTLTKKNDWQENMRYSSLPLTFQQAIWLTRQLGLSYLYIDVLCTCQDDDEDLGQSMSNMGEIYANAFCTIAACASDDVDGGFLATRDRVFQDFPCCIRFSKQEALSIRSSDKAYSKESFCVEVEKSPLNEEAWAFEQRLLSRRVLHFGSKFLFFECNSHICSEYSPQGQPRLDAQHGRRELLNEFTKNRSSTPDAEEELKLHHCWFELVAAYSRTNLKYHPSKRTFLSSLVGQIAGVDNGLTYLNGLWARHITFDLLWYVATGSTNRPTSHQPTWSWHSVNGVVRSLLVRRTDKAEGKRCEFVKVAEVLVQETASISSCLQHSVLTLKCPVLRGSNLNNTADRQNILTVQTSEEAADAEVRLDVTDLDASKELFCAELVRELLYEKDKQATLSSVWSNGLILQRTLDRTPEGVKATYERVGRFWMEWPIEKPCVESKSGMRVKPMFNRYKAQTISLI